MPSAALPPSWRWWAARALLAQQRLLSGRAASIQAALQTLNACVVEQYAGDGGTGDASIGRCDAGWQSVNGGRAPGTASLRYVHQDCSLRTSRRAGDLYMGLSCATCEQVGLHDEGAIRLMTPGTMPSPPQRRLVSTPSWGTLRLATCAGLKDGVSRPLPTWRRRWPSRPSRASRQLKQRCGARRTRLECGSSSQVWRRASSRSAACC